MIDSRFMESYINDLEKSKQAIIKLFESYDIDFCFIGGVVRNEYGSPRMTEDIDLLVSRKDKDKVEEIPIGFIRELTNGSLKFFMLHDPKTRVEVMYSGEKAGSMEGIEYVDPSLLANTKKGSDHMMYLSSFIEYKLSSGIYGKRYKDFGDIQNIIIEKNLPRVYARKHNWREDLIDRYEEIWDETIGGDYPLDESAYNKLYHFTSFESMMNIMLNDELKSDYENQLYFTRNSDLRVEPKSDTSFDLIRMTIDRDKLQSKYKIFPFAHNDLKLTRGDGFSEFEEIIKKRTIKNFINYIDRIDISNGLFDYVDTENLAELIMLIESNNIPYEFVDNFKKR